MNNPDTVERVARALHADKTAFPAWVGDDLTDWGDGELAATVDGTVNFSALARAAITTLTTPADGLGEIADELEMRVGDYRAAEAGSGRQDYLAVQLGRAVVGNIDRIITALRAAQPTERAGERDRLFASFERGWTLGQFAKGRRDAGDVIDFWGSPEQDDIRPRSAPHQEAGNGR